ncbi:hypothetical protein [Streptomyces werraensis]|uniref:hypothetical protein n=1 Tax=Streptomyces werraensis TaxID=68284 RepID=UPI0037CF7A60
MKPVDHQALARRMQLLPGVEHLVHVYNSKESGEAGARRIRKATNPAYQPAGTYEAHAHPHENGTAVWARYVAGVDVAPLPTVMTVRVAECIGDGDVRVAAVEISARCQVCGGPRGEVFPYRFRRDGAADLVCDVWGNPCGHVDYDEAVLAEVRRREARRPKDRPSPPEIKGVEGGRYAGAVDAIAEALRAAPWTRAKTAALFLEELGHGEAAEVVRAFVRDYPTGGMASARAAALYLISKDEETSGEVAK